MRISGYRPMWVMAMFDLPVDSKAAKRNYARFRKHLLKNGFAKMQFSVYIRHCASRESAEAHTGRIERAVPADGEVRIIVVTDKQFERMRVFFGKRRKAPEPPPAQLELF